MKKLILVLCVVIMFFGIVGCPKSSDVAPANNNSGFASPAVTPVGDSPTVDNPAAVPEPATLILLGAGLVGLAIVGREKFKQ